MSPRTPPEVLQRAAKLYEETGSTNIVARLMECSPPTARRYLHRLGIRTDGQSNWVAKRDEAKQRQTEKPLIEPPHFPDDDIPVEDILDAMGRRFEVRSASHEAHTWFEVKVNDDKPIGILWFGDPHIDDNGCNIPVLRRHAHLCAITPGLFGANVGDTTNNWAGRLIRLYAEQDSSLKTARKLARWFMLDSGVPWLIWLIGNHDAWGDGAEVLAQMARQHGTQKIVTHDWEARFVLSFPNDWKYRIHAAHDFKGHSQWNPLHGPMKAGQLGEEADLLVCGDRHNWAVFEYENAARGGVIQKFVRVRGYKFMDDFARRRGFPEQQTGCGILTIFDPRSRQSMVFPDVETGVDILNIMRGQEAGDAKAAGTKTQRARHRGRGRVRNHNRRRG